MRMSKKFSRMLAKKVVERSLRSHYEALVERGASLAEDSRIASFRGTEAFVEEFVEFYQGIVDKNPEFGNVVCGMSRLSSISVYENGHSGALSHLPFNGALGWDTDMYFNDTVPEPVLKVVVPSNSLVLSDLGMDVLKVCLLNRLKQLDSDKQSFKIAIDETKEGIETICNSVSTTNKLKEVLPNCSDLIDQIEEINSPELDEDKKVMSEVKSKLKASPSSMYSVDNALSRITDLMESTNKAM